MSSILDFYLSLPKQVSHFYIRGYTETLALYKGVRVVPNESFIEDLNPKMQSCFYRTKFPCYFIPIYDKQSCYGFVLKGYEKCTPSYRPATFRCLQLQTVQQNDIVYFVEGIKDSYTLTKAGCKALPILSAVPSEQVLTYLKRLNCKVVFISDNDSYRIEHQEQFKRKADFIKLPYLMLNIAGVKDLGEFFDNPSLNIDCRSRVIQITKQIIIQSRNWAKEL